MIYPFSLGLIVLITIIMYASCFENNFKVTLARHLRVASTKKLLATNTVYSSQKVLYVVELPYELAITTAVAKFQINFLGKQKIIIK